MRSENVKMLIGFVLLYSLAQGFGSLSEFAEHLAESVDIVFPAIHGRFGEDGGIQVYHYIILCS